MLLRTKYVIICKVLVDFPDNNMLKQFTSYAC